MARKLAQFEAVLDETQSAPAGAFEGIVDGRKPRIHPALQASMPSQELIVGTLPRRGRTSGGEPPPAAGLAHFMAIPNG